MPDRCRHDHAPGAEVAYRERHSETGRFRVRCNLCPWVSGEFDLGDQANTAAMAHLEAQHGCAPSVSGPRAPACPKCGARGQPGNPLLTQPDGSLLCLRCAKAAQHG